MTDAIFAPAFRPDASPAPGNAQVVYLQPALYVVKGVYHHPLSNDDQPLPKHRWALVASDDAFKAATPLRFAEGNTSDDKGVSTVFRPDTTTGSPDDTWDLWLIPIFDDGKGSGEIVTFGEAYIDVDKNRWVRASEVTDAGGLARVEKRRLLRIPRWSTARKAVAGGGFKETNPDAADFDAKGLIKTSELKVRGTPGSPWTIQIDQGWLKTFVRLKYYDLVAKKEKPVPRGVILEAQQTNAVASSPMRVGASSACRDDGSIYVLHARPEDKSTADLDYTFATPAATTFTYDKGEYASKALGDLARLEKEYPVAPLWHSLGMEAWEGTADASSGARKTFASLRTKGQDPGNPLCFHLDDLVLTDGAGKAITPAAATPRLAIYTGVAALRDPKQSGGGKDLPYSKLQLTAFPLRGEDATFQRGKSFDDATRFIDAEGELYELSTSFAIGSPGTDACVGARAAVLATAISDNRATPRTDEVKGQRVYLFDTRWVRYTYQGKNTRLAHLVVYVPIWVDGSQLNAANNDAIAVLEELMVQASQRWDQNHPGVAGSSSLPKNYAIVPSGGVKDESTVLKLRHVFGSKSTRGDGFIVVQVDTQPGRATGGNPMRLYCQTGPNMGVAPNPAWLGPTPPGPLPTRPYEFEPNAATASNDLDGTSAAWFTFAHELGHECSLVDEYIEPIRPNTVVSPLATGFLPRFNQFGYDCRPYVFDNTAMMQTNRHPRLRYTHNFVEELHEFGDTMADDGWFKKERPFVSQYVGSKKTYTFALPRKAKPFTRGQGQGPWSAQTATQGLCSLRLFPTSVDEGTLGPVFLPAGQEIASAFDGILVVRPMIWFSFVAAPAANALPTPLYGWNAVSAWGGLYSAAATTPHFAIDTPGVDTFKRVAILFQPRFEYQPGTNLGTVAAPNLQSKNDATLEVLLRSGGGAPTFNGAASPPLISVDMDALTVGNWIMRFALQNQPAVIPASPNNGPMAVADLGVLATALGTMLGRAAGTVSKYFG